MKPIFLIAIALFMIDCEFVNNPEEEKGGKDGRIIFGASIDGVKIGDDTTAVLQKFGRPTQIQSGDFDGLIYDYAEGKFAGILVSFINHLTMGMRVIEVKVNSPYSGTTKEGVGIGTQREIALKWFGTPNFSQDDIDYYLFGEVNFFIIYDQNKIIRVQMLAGLREQVNKGRIVWGKSIDGVEIGDDSTTVIQKLSRPSGIGFGDFSGYIYEYYEGIFAGMSVSISDDSTLGLGSGVFAVQVQAPYNGTTKEGIGIGTPREEAVTVFGPPNSTEGLFDTWLFEKSAWIIGYDTTSTIRSISFGGIRH